LNGPRVAFVGTAPTTDVKQAESARLLSVRADFGAFVPSGTVTMRFRDHFLSGIVHGGAARTVHAQLVPGVNVLEVTSDEAVSLASLG